MSAARTEVTKLKGIMEKDYNKKAGYCQQNVRQR